MPTLVEHVTREPAIGGGGGRTGGTRGYGGGGGGGESRRDGQPGHSGLGRLGVWLALAPIVTFFAGFCGAYILRRGLATDWRPLALPPVLWLNTALLAASSIALERARGCVLAGRLAAFNLWWSVTTALGVGFLAGQIIAWRDLVAHGIYLTSNASGGFFYLLTGIHALHLLGGEIALLYVGATAVARGPARLASAVNATRIYWHFLLALWLFLFLLLTVWR